MKIQTIIKMRAELAGWTQAKLAEEIGCTPSQLSLFFKGEASLSHQALENCFTKLGFPFEAVGKRMTYAKEAAAKLKGYSIDQIVHMSRSSMVSKTGIDCIAALPELSHEEFELMVSSGIGDYESCYEYFKTLVMQFHTAPEKMTPKSVEKSLSVLASTLLSLPMLGSLGIGAFAMGMAIGAMSQMNKAIAKAASTAWGPFFSMTLKLIDNKKIK